MQMNKTGKNNLRLIVWSDPAIQSSSSFQINLAYCL